MKILKEPSQRFLYRFEYPFAYSTLDFCRALKAQFGVKLFSFYEGAWRFNTLDAVAKIKERYPEAEISAEVLMDLDRYAVVQQEKELRDKESERLKQAKDSSIVIPSLKIPLYPYQKVGVEFMANANGRAILADQMGTGKTAQALAYAVYTKKAKTLVICPASTKYGWADETRKWTKLKPLVIDSTTNLSYKKVIDHDVFIINYDMLPRFHDDLKVLKIDLLIVDEFHYIKSPSARRSKLTRSLSLGIPSVILLSGTPILNRPVEMFNGLQIIDPHTWNDYYAYTAKYCDGQRGVWGWEAKGATNTEELHHRIQRYFLRRMKKDVLKELPPKTYVGVPVELDDKTKKEYALAEKNFIKYLREIKNKSVAYDNIQVQTLVKLGELRQLSSRGKIESAKELIENIIDGGEKVCVFSVYNQPLEELHTYFGKKSVLLLGKTDIKERPKLIKQFQEDEETKIFLGGLVAAGAGITLTAAENVVFLDFSWVPADHKQAEDRIHRPGQKASSVSIYQMFSKGTIDEKMQLVLAEKQSIVDEIIDGNVGNIKDDIIKSILKKYEE